MQQERQQALDIWARNPGENKYFPKQNNEAYLQTTEDERGLYSINVYLNSQNSKHNEKSTADEDDVPDGPERCDQGLHHKF